VLDMTGEATSIEVGPGELGEALFALRLSAPEARQQMQVSLSRLGQLTPVQAYESGGRLELIDGFKRLHAARALSWPRLRAEVQRVDATGAKVRLLRCNAGAGLSDLEEAWLVKSLYREDQLSQPQIAMLLVRHKSWVCRRLTLAEGLSDELTASLRLGLVSARAAVELARLPRGNQDAAAQVVTRRGLTTRQTARLIDRLLAAPAAEWGRVLTEASEAAPAPALKGGSPASHPRRAVGGRRLGDEAPLRAPAREAARALPGEPGAAGVRHRLPRAPRATRCPALADSHPRQAPLGAWSDACLGLTRS
jgi:ParB-like chromosome segregation protein Spo0J